MEKLTVQKDAYVFREGDEGDAAYVIDSGSIAIIKSVEGTEMRLATVGLGGLFGEMAILDGSPRMASAQALEETILIVVPRQALDSKLSKSDPSLRTVFRVLVQNLRNVHHAYIRRPRSSRDFLNLIEFNLASLTAYMDKTDDRELAADTRPSMLAIQSALLDLKHRFAGHADRRSSVLHEAEMVVPRARPKAMG
ncbi:MAG: cyclic nucleotide-binding domain-containing protein [Rhodospirillales bacterium]|nr:cyclic nucleotide-binding domain-containing protein [Rhodospirillales bacterium]